MKNINPLAIGMAIVVVIVASYFLFGLANMITILAMVAMLVVVMVVPMVNIREKNNREVMNTRKHYHHVKK